VEPTKIQPRRANSCEPSSLLANANGFAPPIAVSKRLRPKHPQL
jgi:hypothetical protein